MNYLAEPKSDGKKPALILIHEWWGLTDHIKDIANRWAKEGYVTLAVDLYDGVTTKDANEAGKRMQGLDAKKALQKLNAAVSELQARKDVGKIGVTGFCMGGTFAMLLACNTPVIKAAAPFYGDPPSADELKELQAPMLFIGADQDGWITMDKMNALKKALGGKVDLKIHHAGHAFFNDTRPDAYDKKAAQEAWKQVTEFFKKTLA